LRRVIQKQLVDKLALALLEGRFREDDTVVADAVEWSDRVGDSAHRGGGRRGLSGYAAS
jgi:ATP-dependent Clp protease ATP-binding subunit ClpA